MSRSDYLSIRFHFGGEFVNDGKTMQYVGGGRGYVYILRSKLGLAEINRHLKLHHDIVDGQLLHWLMPGNLSSGLGVLWQDESCKVMSGHIAHDGFGDNVEESTEQLQTIERIYINDDGYEVEGMLCQISCVE